MELRLPASHPAASSLKKNEQREKPTSTCHMCFELRAFGSDEGERTQGVFIHLFLRRTETPSVSRPRSLSYTSSSEENTTLRARGVVQIAVPTCEFNILHATTSTSVVRYCTALIFQSFLERLQRKQQNDIRHTSAARYYGMEGDNAVVNCCTSYRG